MSKEDEHSPLFLRRREEDRRTLLHEELPKEHEDPMIRVLHIIIRGAVRVLAILLVIIVALFRLLVGVVGGLVFGALNPLEYTVFQTVFGEIMTLLIAKNSQPLIFSSRCFS